MSKQRSVIVSRLVERGDVFAGDYENMCGRLRMKIIEGDAHIVFINFRRRNFTRDYLAKNTALRTHNIELKQGGILRVSKLLRRQTSLIDR